MDDRTMTLDYGIQAISGADARLLAGPLSDLLIDCVHAGASIGFMQPMPRQEADAFWSGIFQGVESGDRVLFVARQTQTGRVLGTVQLVVGQMPNQTHRADVSKLLVHCDARRNGVGTALMQVAEQAAEAAGKTLLVLDTAVGGGAEPLYEGLGWIPVGDIPDYARFPDGALGATRIYYKRLGTA